MNFVLPLATKDTLLTTGWGVGVIIIGFVLLALGMFLIWYYKNRKLKKDAKEQMEFKVVTSKYKMMGFWTHYAYWFAIAACFIGALVLLGLGIGHFIS